MSNKAFIITGDGKRIPIEASSIHIDFEATQSAMGSMSFPREISGEFTVTSASLQKDGTITLDGTVPIDSAYPIEIDTSEEMAYEVYEPERPSELPRNRQNSFGSFLNKGKRW